MRRTWITRNLGWKVGSIGLAVLFWFTANYGLDRGGLTPGSRRTFSNLPITIMTGANERRTYEIDPAVARLALRGERTLLESLQPRDISVFVNLTGIADANHFRRRVDVHTPPGVSLVWVFPVDVTVQAQIPAGSVPAPTPTPSPPVLPP